MEWEVWLAFVGASILISLSPGAGAILSMATGLTLGVRRTYWTILGLQIGLMVQLALVAVGLGAALASSALAFTVIKWLGWPIWFIWRCGSGGWPGRICGRRCRLPAPPARRP